MNDDMDHIEYGQWLWQAMNKIYRIKLKRNHQQAASTINHSRLTM
jgi:hypothetical protein